MNFFDNFVDKTRDAYDVASKKTGEMVEVSKIKFECIKINSEIRKLYEKLGKSVYGMMKCNYENQNVVDSLTEEITEKLEILRELNSKLGDIKSLNICKTCGFKNPEDNYFCAKCGSRVKNEFCSDEVVEEE